MTDTLKKMVNGQYVDMTPDEITELQNQRQAAIAKRNADLAANGYKYSRKAAYPSYDDQLDMMYWDKVNGTTNWIDARAAVKKEFPKPE